MGLSIVIAGGGTGGHLYPGLAVARALLARVADATVTFVGTAAGIESRVIPREGFPLAVIRSAGLKGKSIGAVLRGLLLLPLSAWDAWRTLSRLRPAVVIGVGGYSSGPVVLLAALRGIPTLLMEQNATPGFTNRLLARVVTAAAVTYQESVATFGARAFVAGRSSPRPHQLVKLRMRPKRRGYSCLVVPRARTRSMSPWSKRLRSWPRPRCRSR